MRFSGGAHAAHSALLAFPRRCRGLTADATARAVKMRLCCAKIVIMRSRGQDAIYFNRDSITKCKIFVLNSHHIFDARDLMADWGWGFTNPQPLPNPILSRAKGNFQLAIQKKETEVSLRLTNFVLHMYKQLTSEQRSQIFVLLQKKIKRKEIALLVGCSQSTMSKNSTFA